MNRLTMVKAYEDSTNSIYTQYYYDNAGNKLRMYTGLNSPLTITGLDVVSGTDTDYSVTKYEYDRFGNLTKWTDPEGQDELYTYDYNGNLIEKTDRNNNITEYTFDGLNRIVSEFVSNDNNLNAYGLHLFSYLLIGMQATSYSDNMSTSFTYDERGLMIEENVSDGVEKVYTYDTSGNSLSLTMSVNNSVKSDIDYEYDKFNRLEKVLEGTTEQAVYTYDVNGNRATLEYDNGNFTEYEYNLANSITTLTNWSDDTEITKLSEFTYEYTLDGNRVSEEEIIADEETIYTYDRLGRLLTETEKDNGSTIESYTYTYDDYSNRESKETKNSSGVTIDDTTYTYDLNSRLEEESVLNGSTTTVTGYCYDPNGNQISTWEHEEVSNGTGTPTATLVIIGEDGTSTSTCNTYNGFNQLIRTAAKSTVSAYSYNASGLRTSKTVNGAGTRHIWSGANIIFEISGSDEVQYTRGINLVAMDDGTTESFYLFNAHGDVVHLANASGAVTKTYDYDAFGIEENPDTADPNPFRYCGEYFDKSSGTYYLRARYYNPSTGRFISEDSYMGIMGDPLSLNLYIYCANNPVIYWDPSGHNPADANPVWENIADDWMFCDYYDDTSQIEKASENVIVDINTEVSMEIENTIEVLNLMSDLVYVQVDAGIGLGAEVAAANLATIEAEAKIVLTKGYNKEIFNNVEASISGEIGLLGFSTNGYVTDTINNLTNKFEGVEKDFNVEFMELDPPIYSTNETDSDQLYTLFNIGAYLGLGGSFEIGFRKDIARRLLRYE